MIVSLAATKATREGSNGPSSQLSYGATANLDHQMQPKTDAGATAALIVIVGGWFLPGTELLA